MDICKRRGERALRPPACLGAYPRAIGHEIRHIGGRGFWHRPDFYLRPRQGLALARQLEERDANIAAAADIIGLAGVAHPAAHLQIDETAKVMDMQQVAHLGSGAAVADIGEPATEDVARQPESDEAL